MSYSYRMSYMLCQWMTTTNTYKNTSVTYQLIYCLNTLSEYIKFYYIYTIWCIVPAVPYIFIVYSRYLFIQNTLTIFPLFYSQYFDPFYSISSICFFCIIPYNNRYIYNNNMSILSSIYIIQYINTKYSIHPWSLFLIYLCNIEI